MDMVIYKDQDVPTKLIAKPYQKPLNRYLYIPFYLLSRSFQDKAEL